MEHYPEQPLVLFSYQETSRKDITKQSQKRNEEAQYFIARNLESIYAGECIDC